MAVKKSKWEIILAIELSHTMTLNVFKYLY